jgi:hypothetical protein
MEPSCDLTPSNAFRNPEKVTCLPYYSFVTDSLATKIPSISSRRMIESFGA